MKRNTLNFDRGHPVVYLWTIVFIKVVKHNLVLYCEYRTKLCLTIFINIIRNALNVHHVKRSRYHGMAHAQVVYVRDVFQLWRLFANNLLCLSNI